MSSRARIRIVGTAALLSALATPGEIAAQGGARPLGIEEFLTLDRVSDPRISPDGAWVAYTLTITDLAQDGRRRDVWIVPAAGGRPRRVSDDSLGGAGARWSPDGSAVAYVSTRGGSPPQVHLYRVGTRRTQRLTDLATGADGVVWSPTGTHLAFVSRVFPDCADDACNARRLREAERLRQGPRGYDQLPFRHWASWDDGRRSHLFVVPAAGGPATDLTAGRTFDVPVPPFGGSSDYAFRADGSGLVFTAKPGADRSWHTNSDLFGVGLSGGEIRNLTPRLPGAESHPAPSPDGTMLAFLSQERAGFESDRQRLILMDLASGETRDLTRGFDTSVREFAWLPSARELVFVAQRGQRHRVFRVDLEGAVREVLRRDHPMAVSVADDGNTVAFVGDAMDRPPQVYVWAMQGAGSPRAVTTYNQAVLREVRMHAAEEIQWVGADGATVHGLLVRPPQFTRGQRYPLLVLLHGGPQSAWLDQFHWRWNAQLFAAPGYVTVLLNPRGSTGFGQRFVDQVSGDWGGRVFVDVMAGVEHAARFPFVDSTRIAAAGGSYGGYLVNWLNAHATRFDAFISHAGLYHLEAFYGATDELWFPEWEFGGPPWLNRDAYERWSPHRYAQNFRTPTLVIHGGRDYRVPDTQGFQLFTVLQRQGVPSRLLYFPDEGHWVTRPHNQRIWWREVHAWLARYLGPAAHGSR